MIVHSFIEKWWKKVKTVRENKKQWENFFFSHCFFTNKLWEHISQLKLHGFTNGFFPLIHEMFLFHVKCWKSPEKLQMSIFFSFSYIKIFFKKMTSWSKGKRFSLTLFWFGPLRMGTLDSSTRACGTRERIQCSHPS